MEETNTHTPGPWHWRIFGNDWALTTTHSGSLIVLDCVRKGMNGAQFRVRVRPCRMVPFIESHPDASLLAAAPDLLVACKEALEFVELNHQETSIAVELREAIAKAEGK